METVGDNRARRSRGTAFFSESGSRSGLHGSGSDGVEIVWAFDAYGSECAWLLVPFPWVSSERSRGGG